MSTVERVSLPSLVRWRAEREGEGVALRTVEDELSFTWSDLYDRSRAWSGSLARLGIGQGDVVATMLARGDHAAVSWIGTSGVGALEAPLNHAFKGDWLRRVLATVSPRAVVIDERFIPVWEPLLQELTVPVVLFGGSSRPGFLTSSDLLSDSRPQDRFIEAGPGDPSCIILTSGTTGNSKAVVVPWGRCLGTVRIAEALDPEADGTYYNPFPTFHWAARGPVYRAAFRGTSLVTRESFRTSQWLHDVRRFGCTDTLLLGAMMTFLMSSPEHSDDADNPIRACLGGPIPDFIDDFTRRFGIERVLATYGMSEIVNVFLTPSNSTVTAANYLSCGQEAGFPVRLVGADDVPVATGEVGELQVGGDPSALNLGYLNNPTATAEAWTDDGWFKTGDLFRKDEEGFYYFVDRMKDTLRRRGENISSAEVEAVALRYPGVADCAVVATPSEWSEDEVMIYVVCEPDTVVDPAELTTFMAEVVPSFAVPRFVELIDELPRTPTLKVQKAVLRERGRGPATWDRSPDAGRRTMNTLRSS